MPICISAILIYTRTSYKRPKSIKEIRGSAASKLPPMSFSLLVLLIVTSKFISELKEHKEEIITQAEKQKELNRKTLVKFEEGIKELKSTDIHPALKSTTVHKLIDVYHTESKMIEYKDICMQNETTLFNNIEKIAQRAHNLKNLIKTHKNNVKTNVSKWLGLDAELAKQFKSLSESFETYVVKFTKDYINLKDRLKAVSQDKADDYLVLIGLYESYVMNLFQCEQNFSNMESQLLGFNNEIQKMASMGIENEIAIKDNVKMFERIEGMIQPLFRNINKLIKENLPDVEKAFSRLLTPSLMKGAYEELLTEIGKRRATLVRLDEISLITNKLIEEENKRREEFLNKNGNVLSDKLMNIIPTLKHRVDCSVLFNTQELESLPFIDIQNKYKQSDMSKNIQQDSPDSDKMMKVFELFSLSSELTEEISIDDFEKNSNNRPKLVSLLKNLLIANTKFLLRQIAQNYTYYEPNETKKEITRLTKELENTQGNYNEELQNSKLLLENIEALHNDNKRLKQENSEFQQILEQKSQFIETLIEEKEVQESDYEQEINTLRFTTANLSLTCDELQNQLKAKSTSMNELVEIMDKHKNRIKLHRNVVDRIFKTVEDIFISEEKVEVLNHRVDEIKKIILERTTSTLATTLLVPNKLTNFYSSPSNAESEFEAVDLTNLQDTIEALRIENKEYKLRNDLIDQSLDSKKSEIEVLQSANKTLEEELKTSKFFVETVLQKLESNRKNKENTCFELGDSFLDKTLVFIPFEPGIYIPLVKENSNYVLSKNSTQIRYILNMDSLSSKYSSIAKHNNFIIIAKIDGTTKPDSFTIGSTTYEVESLHLGSLQAIYTFDDSDFTLFTLVD